MSRIILVDDNEHIRTMLRTALEREGYEVDEAPDGEIGIHMQTTDPADLVVTDILMPRKEGFETISELRRKFPDLKIIAISGGGRNEPSQYLNFARSFGADRIFSKPVDLSEFLDAIRDLLSESPVS